MSEIGPIDSYSLQDLQELAFEADAYVNDAKKKKERKRRLSEVIPMLDQTAKQLYLDSPVRLFGVHARSEFQPETGAIRQYLSPGQVVGISEGFSVIYYKRLFESFSGADERQLRLIAELRERALGELSICHLLRRSIVTANRHDYLSSIHVINRALAPVGSSVLLPEQVEASVLSNEERLEELRKILTVSRPETQESFSKIQEAIDTHDDPLRVLSECAPDVRSIFGRADENVVRAVHDYLNLVAGPKLFGSIYNFSDSLPPSLIKSAEGMSILQFPPENKYNLLFTNLVIARDLVQEEGMIRFGNEQVLYIVGHLYENGTLDPSMLFIPLDKLKEADFAALGPASFGSRVDNGKAIQ